jgi:uncharacterized protein
MSRIRLVALLLGAVFGFALAWTGMTDPEQIRRMLLLEDAYLFLVMFSSIAVAFVGVRAVRVRQGRALLTGEPLAWKTGRPERRHLAGSVLFGLGWATCLSCPGPIAAQLGQGIPWSLCTIAGIGAGIVGHARWLGRRVTAAALTPSHEALS